MVLTNQSPGGCILCQTGWQDGSKCNSDGTLWILEAPHRRRLQEVFLADGAAHRSASTDANMFRNIELRIWSTSVNILNFVVFDVALITLVYLLTADVAGRLNDRSLRDGNPRRLLILCPPVLGGGLCSTNRVRALLLLLVRLIGLGLILLSGLAIKGGARAELFHERANALTHGNTSMVHGADSLDEKVFLRSSFQGSRIKGGRTTLHYGELREVQKGGKPTLECITDPALLTGTVVEFDTRIRNVTVTTGPSCKSRKRTNLRHQTVADFFRTSATLTCLFDRGDDQPNIKFCRGVLRHAGDTYIVEEGAAWPQMPAEPTELRWVRGLPVSDTFWLDAALLGVDMSMKDVIDTSFSAHLQRRVVRKRRIVGFTVIHPFWFAALALKILLICALASSSALLKRSGFHPAAHDEASLSVLLHTAIEEKSWPEMRKPGPEVGGIFLNAHRTADGVSVAADIGPRRDRFALEMDANLDLHRLEARYM